MKTIEHFQRALGRKTLWRSHLHTAAGKFSENYVQRLRIYPHALRQQNAYYSPRKKALLFGYFPISAKDGRSTPGATVFTCLSHDIIAHETTHALLDGVHPHFNEPVNQDVLAFHEAFADIVALFQHFSYPGVLRDQIARTRGDLARQSLLGQLAQQFALASGRGDALRSYLGKSVAGVWYPVRPDPTILHQTTEPHDRGAILVSAVFGAFATVYQARTRDLFRIATEGTGVLPEGDIHPDLVNRLAEEAERCADRALQMCIRAIDYCPPVGITFGAYLRAIITADRDMNPIDRDYWRLAFIEHFRWWGISPDGIRFMGEESLLWPTENEVVEENAKPGLEGAEEARVRGRNAVMRLFHESPPDDGDSLYRQKAERSDLQLSYIPSSNILRPVGVQVPRMELWLEGDKQAAMFHFWLMDEDWRWMSDALGLIVRIGNHPRTISARMADSDHAAVEIHSVRTAMKRGELGGSEPHMVVVITQRRAGFFDRGKQKAKDQEIGAWRDPERDFSYRAGCTLLIDPEEMRIRRVIRTPGTVADDEHLDRLRRYLLDGLTPTDAFGSAVARFSSTAEPFAFLHSPGG